LRCTNEGRTQNEEGNRNQSNGDESLQHRPSIGRGRRGGIKIGKCLGQIPLPKGEGGPKGRVRGTT
jgi:hypothetical protein